MNAIRCLGMHERDANASEEAQSHETLFEILKSVVLKGESRSRKDFFGVHEIKAVRGQVGTPLRLVPSKLHFQIVYTDRIFVKRERAQGGEKGG